MAWGAAEWGAAMSAAAAVATAGAGFLALLAAKWTVDATKLAADQNASLLRDQIALQKQEIDELKNASSEVDRRQKLHAAYTIFRLAGQVQEALNRAIRGYSGDGPLALRFTDELIKSVEQSYPLQSFLSRANHIEFQVMDAVVNGEPIQDPQHAQTIVDRLTVLRTRLTPVIVGLPHGEGPRVYGSDGVNALEADFTAGL